MPTLESPSEAPKSKKFLREKVFLAGQAEQSGLKVLPGKSWAFHYPDGEVRRANLQALFEGKISPSDAVGLKPDALIYDINDLENEGLEAVSAKIRDINARIQHYNYDRFADFVASMKGKEVDLDTVCNLYDRVAQNRIRKIMMDALGMTGRKQIERVLRQDAAQISQRIPSLNSANKVLEALKINWLRKSMNYVKPSELNRILSQLSEDEGRLFEQLKKPYQNYVQTGDQGAYDELVKQVQDTIPKLQNDTAETSDDTIGDGHIRPQDDELNNTESPEMEQLRKELEDMMDQVEPPLDQNDSGIPPDDRDELGDPPPPSPGESQESVKSKPWFTIKPRGTSKYPLSGKYCSGKKSYYDINSKQWSKKKRLTLYNTSIQGTEKQEISGTIQGGIKSLPMLSEHALDISSLQYTGAKPTISRDQNGCFYIQANGRCEFSIDFLKEPVLFQSKTLPDDIKPLYRGSLSSSTESKIANLNGNNLEKAQQIQKYILQNHFYPGGGDLKMAQALQLKLLQQSTGDNYIHNLDASEYLECRSANTLFAAMLRKANIPTRFIVGHNIDSACNGKAVIDENTGHAWCEIWDGNKWVGIDATPPAKLEDKKKEDSDKDQKDESTPTEKADDGGVDKPKQDSDGDQEREGQQPDQSGKNSDQQSDGQSNDSSDTAESSNNDAVETIHESSQDTIGEATDQDVQDAESELEDAQEKVEKANEKKKELEQKIRDAENFKDLDDIKKEVDSEDLFDDMEKNIKEKTDTKKEQMKDEIKEELEKMAEDGFIDKERKEEFEDILEQDDLAELDKVRQQIELESQLYNEYEEIRLKVQPLVDKWFKYFAEKLPRKLDIDIDTDSRTRAGRFDRRSVMQPRNLLFGTIKNPRIVKPSIEPRFMAALVLDVSGSMSGKKLKIARKMLIFYCELFEKIGKEFGYIFSAIHIFSDSVIKIKGYDMDYDSSDKYQFEDGSQSTIKVRIMKTIKTMGGTNMLTAIQQAAKELNKHTYQYPDYASALYFMGDGGDTCGNAANIRNFLQIKDSEYGFGNHMLSATMLGSKSQKQELANIFGDDHVNVAPDFEELVFQNMQQFDIDISWYMDGKVE